MTGNLSWQPTEEEIHAYVAAARAEHRRVVDTVTGMDYPARRDQIAAAGLRAAYALLQQRVTRHGEMHEVQP